MGIFRSEILNGGLLVKQNRHKVKLLVKTDWRDNNGKYR